MNLAIACTGDLYVAIIHHHIKGIHISGAGNVNVKNILLCSR